ncbi:MAG: DivIVA domain-containing protein [Pseudomonadota bacterium]
MGITPAVIRQKEFSSRFRGFDVQEVDHFLEEIADEIEDLNKKIMTLTEENHRLTMENQSYKNRESSLKKIMLHSQKVLEQMKNNSKKTAETIIAEAEVTAEKLLNRAHQRLSQLHTDISELKRQRIQIEVQIGSVLEAHSKLLEMSKLDNKNADEKDSNLRFIKQA